MPQMELVSVALTGDQITALKSAVDSGEYATEGEILREALSEWERHRMDSAAHLQRLRELWDEGEASGPGAALDPAEFLQEARQRLAAETARQQLYAR